MGQMCGKTEPEGEEADLEETRELSRVMSTNALKGGDRSQDQRRQRLARRNDEERRRDVQLQAARDGEVTADDVEEIERKLRFAKDAAETF
eukprot:gene13929-46646_t